MVRLNQEGEAVWEDLAADAVGPDWGQVRGKR
jgi:hypothetical protein